MAGGKKIAMFLAGLSVCVGGGKNIFAHGLINFKDGPDWHRVPSLREAPQTIYPS